jgi:hypothetical protein
VDNLQFPNQSGNVNLIDALNRFWRAMVVYTTDGNGNVIPITGSGGGGVQEVSGNVGVSGAVSIINALSGAFQPEGLTVQGLTTMVPIDSNAWYQTPPVPLLIRNNIEIQNPSNSPADMLWVYDPTMPATAGFHVSPGGSRSIQIRGDIPVYTRLAPVSGSIEVVCEELA